MSTDYCDDCGHWIHADNCPSKGRTGRMVECYACMGRGYTIPPLRDRAFGQTPQPPRECKLCHGSGKVEVRK